MSLEQRSVNVVALLDNGRGNSKKSSSYAWKVKLVQMLYGGVVLEVSSVKQARITEVAGAIALVMVKENVYFGVNRMNDLGVVHEIKKYIRVPIISHAQIRHFVEAHILEAIGMDFIDKSETLIPTDDTNFINKHNFWCPFVCGCNDLGEALRRVAEGAALVRTKGSQTGNVLDVIHNVRAMLDDVRHL